ncbi:hypothetical protein T484DRAFT_1808555 [Baffinella frigidus]|nr:hypothetical protein T484DRAFT_1808555 [Cryptophyta sp. CCMP2293]
MEFGSRFALKRAMNSWTAPLFLFAAMLIHIVFFGYIYRLSEISACFLPGDKHWKCQWAEATTWTTATGAEFTKANDIWILNSMWFIYVTLTTVGYGDMSPDTNFGRFFSVLACFLGILLTDCLSDWLSD